MPSVHAYKLVDTSGQLAQQTFMHMFLDNYQGPCDKIKVCNLIIISG
jgi:hypothetical protein